MFEGLTERQQRAREIEQLLADPAVLKDRQRYQELAKELSELRPLVGQYEQWAKADQDVRELEDLLRQRHEPEFVKLTQEELDQAKQRLGQLARELEERLIGEDAEADRGIVVEIRAGTGGLEASLFAADLHRMYARYAAQAGLVAELLSSTPTEAGGFKEVIFSVEGKAALQRFKYEGGVHRVQRVPATEASGRIHTSTATVAILPEPKEVEVKIEPKELRVDVYRASSAGGQHVNVTDSAVRITHLPTGLVVTCQDERSQHKNKGKAMKVLRARLYQLYHHWQHAKLAHDRRQQVGTGERSEKIRTYNFPDRRVTDHRIGLTLHRLEDILNGNLDQMITALAAADRQDKLKAR